MIHFPHTLINGVDFCGVGRNDPRNCLHEDGAYDIRAISQVSHAVCEAFLDYHDGVTTYS